MDNVLHAERTARRSELTRLDALPDGTMLERQGRAGTAWLKAFGVVRPWSHEGYGPAEAAEGAEAVRPVTVPALAAVLTAGYQPALHASAARP
jgi:hypothetical protein